jgi:molybdopterin-guanine dinucleotide biosynthesis protein A
VLCRSDEGLEPLLAVWRPALALATLQAALDAGVRSMRDALARLPSVVVPPEEWRRADPGGASFRNWNTPADLA